MDAADADIDALRQSLGSPVHTAPPQCGRMRCGDRCDWMRSVHQTSAQRRNRRHAARTSLRREYHHHRLHHPSRHHLNIGRVGYRAYPKALPSDGRALPATGCSLPCPLLAPAPHPRGCPDASTDRRRGRARMRCENAKRGRPIVHASKFSTVESTCPVLRASNAVSLTAQCGCGRGKSSRVLGQRLCVVAGPWLVGLVFAMGL